MFAGANPTSFSAPKSGTTTIGTDGTSRLQTMCIGGVTQVNSNNKASASFRWTAPTKGSGTVTAWALVIVTVSGTNYNAKAVLTESVASSTQAATSSVTPSSSRISVSQTPSMTRTSPSQSKTRTQPPVSYLKGETPGNQPAHFVPLSPV